MLYRGSGDEILHTLNFELDGGVKYPSSLGASRLCFEMFRVRMSVYHLLAINFTVF